jgi:hypothetical protein
MAAIGLGMNLFAENQNAANADAIAKAQYEQALRNTEFQNTERESLYNQQVDARNVAISNNENELLFREANELNTYNFQEQQRIADFEAANLAYEQSQIDFDTQKGINEDAERLALAQTQQKFNDQETSLGFQRQQNLINQLGQYNSMVTRLDQAQSAVDDALMEETLLETAALRDRDQEYDRVNYALDKIREQAGEAQTRTDLENVRLQEQLNAQRTATNEQLMLLDQAKQTDELDTDNAIYRNQLQTRQRVALEELKLDQALGNIEGNFTDKELATEQLLERLKLKNQADNTSFDTQIENLTDQQKYNLLSRDTDLGELGFELEQTRLEYQQNRAAQSFKQEANRIEQLVNSGQISAQGRKGASAARSINNILAAAGRQSAQLTDAILRGKDTFESRVTEIGRKKEDVIKRFGLQKDSTDLRIGQVGKERADVDAIFEEEKTQAKDSIEQERINKERAKTDVSAMSALTIGQTQQTATQFIGDANESKALRNDQSYQRAVFLNDKFTNAFNSLTAEQNLLAENLQQQLNAFSRQSGDLNQRKEFARQNYNVAYQRAQEVHDSALRRYNDTYADVERERSRQGQQDTLFEDQYQASLQSAEQARLASVSQITLDKYSADVTADKATLPKPVAAPAPPKPLVYPRTDYPEIQLREALPLPEEGYSLGVTYAGAVGSFASDLAGISWGGGSGGGSGGT